MHAILRQSFVCSSGSCGPVRSGPDPRGGWCAHSSFAAVSLR
jgi:hypothetical protein